VVRLCFFVAAFEKSSRGLAHDEKRIGKKKGLAIMLVRATIASPPYHEEESSWCL
jgi:hypothetical protein